jgi:hypothetical protein
MLSETPFWEKARYTVCSGGLKAATQDVDNFFIFCLHLKMGFGIFN